MKVENLQEDLAYIQTDSSKIARNDDFLKSLNKDMYVYESMNILRDIRSRNKFQNQYFQERLDIVTMSSLYFLIAAEIENSIKPHSSFNFRCFV